MYKLNTLSEMSEETTQPEESLEAQNTEATETMVAEDSTSGTTEETTPPARETAHDDFDWSISNRHQYIYPKDEYERLEKLYEKTLGAVNENEVIKASLLLHGTNSHLWRNGSGIPATGCLFAVQGVKAR